MVKIDVRGFDVSQVVRGLDRLQREQIPFAMALALTQTAKDVQAAEQKEMRDVFDRPTPYTLRSLFLRPATKQRLEAQVFFKDESGTTGKGTPATKYLLPQVFGGLRNQKRFERALQRSAKLPPGHDQEIYAVPGEGARLDSFGNLSRGQIVQILSDLRLLEQVAGAKQNRLTRAEVAARRAGGDKRVRYKRAKYFIGAPGDGRLPLGVWEYIRSAFGRGIRPVLIFVSRPQYEPRFDFFDVGRRVADKEFVLNFRVALTRALATARLPGSRRAA